jgi:hypothetical protein
MSWLDRKADEAATKRAQHLMNPGETVLATEVGRIALGAPQQRTVTCCLLLTEQAVYLELKGTPFMRFDLLALGYVVSRPTLIKLYGPYEGFAWEINVRDTGDQFHSLLLDQMLSFSPMQVVMSWRGNDAALHYTPWRAGHPASWTGTFTVADDADGFAMMQQAWRAVHRYRAGITEPGVSEGPINEGRDGRFRAVANWLSLPPPTHGAWGHLVDESSQGNPVGVLAGRYELVWFQQPEEFGFAAAPPLVTRIEYDRVMALDFWAPEPTGDRRLVRALVTSVAVPDWERSLNVLGTKTLLLGLPTDWSGDQVGATLQTQTVRWSWLYRNAPYNPLERRADDGTVIPSTPPHSTPTVLPPGETPSYG